MSDEREKERPAPSADAPSAAAGGDRAQEAKQAPAKGGEEVKHEVARASREVRHQAHEITATAVEQADQYAARQKEAGAEHVANLARAVNRAAGELEGTSPEPARYARQAASSVDSFSSRLRQRSVQELVADVDDFVRREPALFFAGAVMAGIVVSRFLLSSEEREHAARHHGAPGPAARAPGSGGY